MSETDFIAMLLMGLLGSGHCVGMCGPFAIAAAAGPGGMSGAILRSIAYQLGKAVTYLFLAVLFHIAGGWVAAEGTLPWMQNALAAATGLAMIALGAAYALELRGGAAAQSWLSPKAGCGVFGALIQSQGWWRSLFIGWLNGFLPCGLSLMALVYAAGLGGVLATAAGAAVFGLATLPALTLTALFGTRLFSGNSRRWLLRLAGGMLVAMGVITIIRGVPVVHEWFHTRTVIPW
jgi:sulfite exporter TauE/SafE